ncbi:MAG TPA: redoxin domain-containing protein [Pyrinomonadaceae bacterium]
MLKKPTSQKLSGAALWALVLLLAVANGLLIRQNLGMRKALAAYQPQRLEAGAKVQPFTAAGLSGDPVAVNYGDGGTKKLLFYFTRTCPYCRDQFPRWREILERVDGERFEVIGLVDEAEDKPRLEEYLRSVGCASDSPKPLRVAFVPKEVRRNYKLTATPVTLLVSNDGTVEKLWEGRWGDVETTDAGRTLGLDFGGL